jgi:chromosome segregation ATPase
MSILLALMIAGFGIGGWFVFNQQQELLASERERAQTEDRLRHLEARLRATDETMTEAGADTDEQLNFWESEIRKVWDIANKRNKKWIQDNQAAVASHQSTLNSVESSLADLRSAVSRNDTKLQQQGELIERLADVQEQVRTLVRQHRDLVDSVNTSRQVIATLKASLEPRVEKIEEAISAIDGSRRQTGAQWNRLRDRIEELERQLDESASVPAVPY